MWLNIDNVGNDAAQISAALNSLNRPCPVVLYTDSTYLRKGVTEWLGTWKKNGWKTAAKKPVKNDELWRSLDRVSQVHQIEWRWVKGHSGNPGNEKADELANKGIPK